MRCIHNSSPEAFVQQQHNKGNMLGEVASNQLQGDRRLAGFTATDGDLYVISTLSNKCLPYIELIYRSSLIDDMQTRMTKHAYSIRR